MNLKLTPKPNKIDKLNWLKNNKLYVCLFLITILYTSWIGIKVVLAATNSSIDMQWFPSIQFFGIDHTQELKQYLNSIGRDSNWLHFEGSINPYKASLDGKNSFLAQAPNYSHLLYIAMYPFAKMSFYNAKVFFAIFSMICFILSAFLVYRFYKNKNLILIFSILALAGFALSNVVANGQYALILGFFTMLGFIKRDNALILGICLCLIVIKYSFGVPIALAFLLLRYYRGVGIAVVLSLLFVGIYQLRFGGGFIYNLMLPLEVNKATLSNTIGPSDLMSLAHHFFHADSIQFKGVYALIAIIYAIYTIAIYLKVRSKNFSENNIIASSITLSLASLYHLGYDSYLLYIVLLLVGLSSSKISLYLLLSYTAFIFLGDRVLKALGYSYSWAMNMGATFTLITTICLFVITILLIREKSSNLKNINS